MLYKITGSNGKSSNGAAAGRGGVRCYGDRFRCYAAKLSPYNQVMPLLSAQSFVVPAGGSRRAVSARDSRLGRATNRAARKAAPASVVRARPGTLIRFEFSAVPSTVSRSENAVARPGVRRGSRAGRQNLTLFAVPSALGLCITRRSSRSPSASAQLAR